MPFACQILAHCSCRLSRIIRTGCMNMPCLFLGLAALDRSSRRCDFVSLTTPDLDTNKSDLQIISPCLSRFTQLQPICLGCSQFAYVSMMWHDMAEFRAPQIANWTQTANWTQIGANLFTNCIASTHSKQSYRGQAAGAGCLQAGGGQYLEYWLPHNYALTALMIGL